MATNSVKLRQHIERRIVRATIAALLAADYLLGVKDGINGGEVVLKFSKDPDEIFKAMFSTDDDELMVFKPDQPQQYGFVQFVYGNDGYDVIHDHTVNLGDVLQPVSELADRLADNPIEELEDKERELLVMMFQRLQETIHELPLDEKVAMENLCNSIALKLDLKL
jgi:hypothetical protein